MFSVAPVAFYVLTSGARGFQLLHILKDTCHFLGCFDRSHPNEGEVNTSYFVQCSSHRTMSVF